MSVFLAVDLGASSGRVMAGVLRDGRLEVSEAYRFANGPVIAGGHMHWDLLAQWDHVCRGLAAAADRYGGRIASVGVDTWGVDFGLLGRHDELLGNPYHYRDRRTQGIMPRALQLVDRESMFAETGIQFLEFNTVFQLLAMKWQRSSVLEAAETLMMMPDLFHWLLSGEKSCERTDASTTQLVDPREGNWSWTLLERLDLRPSLFQSLSEPATRLGPLRTDVAGRTGLSGVDVVLPAAHDTASAVVAVPAAAGGADWCYISSGTWMLMGAEVPGPVITEESARLNFTNEAGVNGTTRLLKNIMGLWLLQECRRIWQRDGRDRGWEEMIGLARQAPALQSVADADDARFLAPDDMPHAIRQACADMGQPVPETDGAVIRCALESIALKCRRVFEWLEQLAGGRIEVIHIVGGGTRNRMLCQMTADACQRHVLAGPIEATATGNVLMQAVAAGAIGSLHDARSVVRRSFSLEPYEPRDAGAWDEAASRLASAEARRSNSDS